MKLKTLILLPALLTVCLSCTKEETAESTPPDIPVFQTVAQEVPIYMEFVGQIYGFKDIMVKKLFFHPQLMIEENSILSDQSN